MKHQEYQLRKFGNTYLPRRDLKPGVECSLKKHFTSGTITRELAGWIDRMAAANKYRFVYAKPKALAQKCRHWKKGEKGDTYKLRAVEYALELFEALGLIFYTTIFFNGAERRGFVVLDHSHAATREGNSCDLHTFGSVWSQHFYPRPGLPPLPRPGGRRDSKWKAIAKRTLDVGSTASGAAGAQSSAQSSAQSLSASAQPGAQTKEIQCAIEGEQKVENASDAVSDPKFGRAEPLEPLVKEPIEPIKPAGTPVVPPSFDQARTRGKPTVAELYIERHKADSKVGQKQTAPQNNTREVKAACSEKFESLLMAGLSDSAFFSTASDGEFNYIALDRYPHKDALRLACAKVADGMARSRYEGRRTNARLMADAMALLKEQGIKSPGGWYPAIKRLRAPYPPTVE